MSTEDARRPKRRWIAAGCCAIVTCGAFVAGSDARVPVGDLNGDGKADLVWRNATSGAHVVWHQNGLATQLSTALPAAPGSAIIAAGDFNGDGKIDLVWRNATTGVTTVALMNGVNVLASTAIGGDLDWTVVASGDFNGDGKTDLVWRHAGTGSVTIWLMNGAAHSAAATVGGGLIWSPALVADIDGDGKTDLVWRNAQTGHTVAWLMNGTAATAARFLGGDLEWELVEAVDVDASGSADLVWRNLMTGTTVLWRLTAGAVTSARVLGGDIHWQIVGAGDFTGDRSVDLVWRDAKTGAIAIMLMQAGAPAATQVVGGDGVWSLPSGNPVPHLTPLAYAERDAARLLAQASFGASRQDIDAARAMGPDAWIARQFSLPQTLHLNTVRADPNFVGKGWSVLPPSIWKQYFEGGDQLRQRIVFALSQILVISLNNNTLLDAPCGPAYYLDLLGRHAFGNFRDILREVALSPAMGHYLDMKGAAKADPVALSIPNENFARELLQLFSIGTVLLNPDGTPQLGSDGKPIAAYDEAIIQDIARALSGWHFGGQDQTKPWRWLYPDTWDPDPTLAANKSCAAWSRPMEPWLATYRSADDARSLAGPAHDQGPKRLLRGASAAAGQTPAQDVDSVVDNVFLHPNVGPFIGRQLIERLVTSNPSRSYVARVAAAFDNNGSAVRGDMRAVIRAILLDPEARSQLAPTSPRYGKLREPVLRFVQLHRAFYGRMAGGHYGSIWNLSGDDALGQAPLYAPSVFNFFHPDYAPSGIIADTGLVGPEFEITTSSSLAGFADFSKWAIIGGFGQYDADPAKWIRPDYSSYLPLATSDPAQLLDELSLVLMGGSMSAQFRAQLLASINKVGAWPPGDIAGQRVERLKMALWLIINSPEYMIQK